MRSTLKEYVLTLATIVASTIYVASFTGCDSTLPESDGGSQKTSFSDGPTCPSETDADLLSNGYGPGQVVATGTAKGDAVDCTFCGVAVSLATSTTPDVTTLYIDSTVSNTSSCSTPSDASNVWILGGLGIVAAKPGVYQGPSLAPSIDACSSDLTVSYNLPYEAGTVIPDCGDSGVSHGLQSCPAGCLSYCAIASDEDDGGDGGDGDVICSPCESGLTVPDEQYSVSLGCELPTMTNVGSWTVTLTSVVPSAVPADAGLLPGVVVYTVHGSLTATLFAGYNQDYEFIPTSSVTVTLAF
jgi:hypothetical protein